VRSDCCSYRPLLLLLLLVLVVLLLLLLLLALGASFAHSSMSRSPLVVRSVTCGQA
jgi:hypothetical protein